MMKTKLPDGYTTRMAGMEDLPAIHELEVKKSLHYAGTPGMTLERIRNEYELPNFDPSQSVLLIENHQGSLAGFVEVRDETEPPVHPLVWISVDPELENQGLEPFLLDWGEDRARQTVDRVDPELRVVMWIHCDHKIESARRAILSAGLKEIRHSFRMRIELDEAPPQPDWPTGIHLRPYDPEQDARLVYETDEEVFQDHFGFVKEDPQVGFDRFMHHMTGDDSYDPSLWFLAVEDEELAAICICRRYGPDERDSGYISSLGVKRDWRRRGIAQALLRHAFDEFYRRGIRKVSLGVDAESLTGATELYRKVGMSVYRQFDMFEKVLRPGRDISVTDLV
jgi:mycothiol synthase